MTRLHKSWAPGPWDSEPDRVEWTDEGTGLDCVIHRAPYTGHLSGYVRIPDGHPWHGVDAYPDAEVHGSVTWTGPTPKGAKLGEGWWVGFDCGHYWDLRPSDAHIPGMRVDMDGDTIEYRDLDYVRGEVTRLASQVAAAGGVA